MTGAAHIVVRDVSGDRIVVIDQTPFTIGRRETNHLPLRGTEVSREHAEITRNGATYVLHDRASRYGTFVNETAITDHELTPGDRIRLGRGGGADMVFG